MRNLFFIFLIFTLFFPVPGSTGDTFPYENLKQNPSLKLETAFSLPATQQQIKWLLENIDLSCEIIRFLKLENFEAVKIDESIYSARDNAGLEGIIYEIETNDTSAIFSGKGKYSGRRIPFYLRGKAVVILKWSADTNDSQQMDGQMYIQVDNIFLHYTSRLVSPIIRRIAAAKTDNIKNVGKELFEQMDKQTRQLYRKLKEEDKSRANEWKILFTK